MLGQLHDAVGVNCKKSATTENQAQILSLWDKGCILDNCVCVILFDMTTSP